MIHAGPKEEGKRSIDDVDLFFGGVFLWMRLYRALRGCSCGTSLLLSGGSVSSADQLAESHRDLRALTEPYPEPLPMYGHSFVPVAACPSSTPNPLPVPQKKNSLFIVKNGICSFQVKLLLTS